MRLLIVICIVSGFVAFSSACVYREKVAHTHATPSRTLVEPPPSSAPQLNHPMATGIKGIAASHRVVRANLTLSSVTPDPALWSALARVHEEDQRQADALSQDNTVQIVSRLEWHNPVEGEVYAFVGRLVGDRSDEFPYFIRYVVSLEELRRYKISEEEFATFIASIPWNGESVSQYDTIRAVPNSKEVLEEN